MKALHSSTYALLALDTAENAAHHHDHQHQDDEQGRQAAYCYDSSEVIKKL